MATRERNRLKILHRVRQQHITQKHAAELGLSVRWVRALMNAGEPVGMACCGTTGGNRSRREPHKSAPQEEFTDHSSVS